MNRAASLRPLAKLAWRDLRRARVRNLWILAALSISVASLTGVRGAQRQAQAALAGDLRGWLGGDVAASTGDPIDADAVAALDALHSEGIRWTAVTFTMVMLRSANSPDPRPAALKIVDPGRYPLYPGLTLHPPLPLDEALAAGSTAVSAEVLEYLHVAPGDTLSIGGQPFHISAVIEAEPDRFNGFPGVPTRVLLSRAAYRAAGLARPGNAAKHYALLRLPPGQDPDRIRGLVQAILPNAAISDYRESNRQAVSAVRASIAFLGVTAVLMLVVSAGGVRAALRQHVLEQAPFIAILKMLGARPTQIAIVFLLQVAALLGGALVLGAPLGILVRDAVLALAVTELPEPPAASIGAGLAEALALFAMCLAAALPAALRMIHNIGPWEVLRGVVAPRPGRWPLPALLLAAALFLLLAVRLTGSWQTAGLLFAALAACLGVGALLAEAALALVRRTIPRLPGPILRHGMANLSRSAGPARLLIVPMAAGLLVAITTFALHGAIAGTIVEALPFGEANLFVAGFESPLRDRILSAMLQLPGATGPPDLMTQARLRLTHANGAAVSGGWRETGCLPTATPVAAALFVPAVVAAETARDLGLRVGSRLDFAGSSGVVQAQVVEIRPRSRVERFRYTSFTLDCGRLDRPSLFHIAAIRVAPEHLVTAQRALAAEFPMAAVFTVADLARSILRVAGDALSLTWILAAYVIVASLAVLAAVVASLRRSRLREMAVLAALGATRGALVRTYAVEFAACGVLAALIAGLLSCGFLSVALTLTLERPSFVIAPRAIACAFPAAALLSVAAGWAPLWRSLGRKPLEVLRDE